MSDFLGIDVSDLNHLALDFAGAGARMIVELEAVAKHAGFNVMTEARELAPHGPTTRAYPRSITYDTEIIGGSIIVEIGPDKDLEQGPLGNLLEYGTSGQAPHPHVQPAFDHEEPRFEEHATAVVVKNALG